MSAFEEGEMEHKFAFGYEAILRDKFVDLLLGNALAAGEFVP